MKILMFSMDACFYRGKSHEILVAEEIARAGHELILITERKPHGYDKEIPKNVTNYVMPINQELSWENFKLLKSLDFDVCFASSVTGARWANMIAQEKGVKSVVQVLDVPVWRLNFKHWHEQWLSHVAELMKSDIVIANTVPTTEHLGKLSNNLLSSKMRLIYYGIDTETAEKIQAGEKKNQICFVSGLRWYKGLDIAIYALSQVKDAPPLVVVGLADGSERNVKTPNGEVPVRYVHMANQLGVDIQFAGGVEDKEKFKIIKESCLAVFPDYSESITSMFPSEAVYCGTPCIVGAQRINKQRYGNTVQFVEDRFNTGAWAEHIKAFLEVKDRDDYTGYSKDAKKWIMKNRSFKSHAAGLVEVFEECQK